MRSDPGYSDGVYDQQLGRGLRSYGSFVDADHRLVSDAGSGRRHERQTNRGRVELFTSGTDSGLAIFAGGIDAETTNGTTPNFPTCEANTDIHQTTQTATDLFDPTPRRVHGDRRAAPVSRRLWLRYPQRGFECGRPGGDRRRMRAPEAWRRRRLAARRRHLRGTTAQTDYYELYSPSTGTWTLGTAAPASTPANAPASAVLP